MSIRSQQAQSVATALTLKLRLAKDAEEVVTSVAQIGREAWPSLWRASLRRYLAEEGQLEIVAVWSAAESGLTPGVRMSVVATSFVEVLSSDRPILSSEQPDDGRMLIQILASEGAESWVSIPIHYDDVVVGVLSLSSYEREGFTQGDLPLCTEIGHVVEGRLAVFGDPLTW